AEIKYFLSNYRLANRSNPVGFSGFLSLKTLQNLLEISKKEQETLRSAAEEQLRFMTEDLPEDFRPSKTPLLKFADEFLPLPNPQNSGNTDLSEVYRLRSEEAKEAVKVERAKFLPKIAAFAESYTYDGSRDRANAYNAGLFLRMNLLDPSDLGAVDQAKADLDVVRKKAEETKLREESHFRILIVKERNILENLNSIYDSMRIQEEQLRISSKLFREGTLSAPQMATSFSKSAELLRMKSDSESEYLKTRAQLSLYNKRGARHEN
ncbi:TolC family protein, partial [Leptospira gomenensis]